VQGDIPDTDIEVPYKDTDKECFKISVMNALFRDPAVAKKIQALKYANIDTINEIHGVLQSAGYEMSNKTAKWCNETEKTAARKPSLLSRALDPEASKGWGMSVVVPTSKGSGDEGHTVAIDFVERIIYDGCVDKAYTLTLENLGKVVPGSDGCIGIAKIFSVALTSSKKRKRMDETRAHSTKAHH